MEMRMQEAQLETELNWMENNPGKTPPWVEARMYNNNMSTADFIPELTPEKAPLSLGLDFSEEEEKKVLRSSDGKFKKKE